MRNKGDDPLEPLAVGEISENTPSAANDQIAEWQRPWLKRRIAIIKVVVPAALASLIAIGLLTARRNDDTIGNTSAQPTAEDSAFVPGLKLNAPTATKLVVPREEPLLVADLDKRTTREYDLVDSSELALTSRGRQRILTVGRNIVVTRDGHALALSTSGDGRPTDLGAAEYVFPSRTPGRVWLVSAPDKSGRVQGTEVTLLGSAVDTSISFEPELLPLADTPGGFVTYDQRSHLSISDSLSGSRIRELTVDGVFLASWRNLVAWRAVTGCVGGCSIHLYDLESGREQTVSPPSEATGFIDGAAFSPNGTTLAAFAQVPPPNGPKALLALIDADTGTSKAVRSTEVLLENPVARAVWDKSNQWVFYSGGRGSIMAYHVGAKNPVELGIQASLSFIAVPS